MDDILLVNYSQETAYSNNFPGQVYRVRMEIRCVRNNSLYCHNSDNTEVQLIML